MYKQMEFKFMSDKTIYELGESVVNRNNLKTGKVVDAVDADSGDTESVKLQYEDGSIEWMSTDSVSRMLMETDPKPNSTQFLTDQYPQPPPPLGGELGGGVLGAAGVDVDLIVDPEDIFIDVVVGVVTLVGVVGVVVSDLGVTVKL